MSDDRRPVTPAEYTANSPYDYEPEYPSAWDVVPPDSALYPYTRPSTGPRKTLLELFAGTGSLGLAVEDALGATTTHVAEYDPAASKVLAHHFPGVPNLHDVTTADWGSLPRVDVISGGSPCQDISGAGRRAGMIAGQTRSGLWESQREAVAVLRPKYVVWENVRAATTSTASSALDPDGKQRHLRALGRVLGDLASLGYDAEWVGVRASDVGACHQRFRVFLLAWDRYAVPSTQPDAEPYARWDELGDTFHDLRTVGTKGTANVYRDKMPTDGAMRSGHLFHRPALAGRFPEVPYLRTPCAAEAGGGPLSPAQAKAQGRTLRLTGQVLDLFHPGVLDPVGKHLPTPGANLGTNGGPQDPDKRRAGGHSVSIEDVAAFRLTGGWGEYLQAVERHAGVFGMPIPQPTEPGAKAGSRPRLAPKLTEWMMCMADGWVTDPALELSRGDQLKLCGNGVVRPQATYGLRVMDARRVPQGVRVTREVLELEGALF